jgi:hypothetical protein
MCSYIISAAVHLKLKAFEKFHSLLLSLSIPIHRRERRREGERERERGREREREIFRKSIQTERISDRDRQLGLTENSQNS